MWILKNNEIQVIIFKFEDHNPHTLFPDYNLGISKTEE